MPTPLEGWMGWFIASFLGLSVGSFANVAIHRVPREGLSVHKPGRSFCPSCATQLSWFDNIPVLAWVVLRGKCRSCSERISIRYPAIELLVGALFAFFWWKLNPGAGGSWVLLLVGWVMATLCVVVSAIDLEHFIIPDVITLPGIALGLLASGVFPEIHASHAMFRSESAHTSSVVVGIVGLVAGGGSLWLVGRLGNLMLKSQVEAAGVEDAMGLGDVKWMAFAGTLLGPILVLESIMIGCFAGAVVGIGLKVVARLQRSDSPVGLPFGPFLSLGILIEMLWPGSAWDAMSWLQS